MPIAYISPRTRETEKRAAAMRHWRRTIGKPKGVNRVQTTAQRTGGTEVGESTRLD
jgi:hypothetical protein